MTAAAATPLGGLYEHWYGTQDIDAAIAYWGQLGFRPLARGGLDAASAGALYGHAAPLESVRLRHAGTDRQGLIRVMRFAPSAGPGLGLAHALALGSRWSGFYTRDILAVQDAYRDGDAQRADPVWKVSPVARLFLSPEVPGFFRPFVGIRETTVFGPEHRQAFLQRVGFDRPGFGTFAEGTPLPVTECSHGNLVIPSLDDLRFYEAGLGLALQTPGQVIDWSTVAVRSSLGLGEGEAFSVIVYQAPGEPSGFLRLYAPRESRPDLRGVSRAGHLGLCAYSWRYPAGGLPARRDAAVAAGAQAATPVLVNEFGEPACTLLAPDGCFWALQE